MLDAAIRDREQDCMIPLLVPSTAAALRRNNFDAIRLAMALLVVWSHSFALWLGSERTEPVSLLMAGTYNSGNLAVLAFFTISGFLITLSWTNSKGWFQYLRRRFARIYPGYLVAVTLCSLVVVPAFSSRAFGALTTDEVVGLASNVLLRNYIIGSEAFGHGPVNGSLWSIPYEFWCYFGVMALGLAGLLRWRPIYLLIAVAVMAGRFQIDMSGWRPGGGFLGPIFGEPYWWLNVLPPFLLGGAIYLYRNIVPRSGLLLLVLIGATLGAAHLPVADPLRTAVTHLFLPPMLTYLIFYAAFSPVPRLHGAARYGDFSYGTYLYAFPIQQMLVVLLKDRVGFTTFVLLSLATSLLAGIASWHLVERWFLPRRRAGTTRLPTPDGALAPEAAIVAP